MERTNLQSDIVSVNKTLEIKNVTSLTVSNHGTTDLYLSVNGVSRLVPALNATYRVPFGAYNFPGDGTVTDKLELKFEFTGAGTNKAIIDYRTLITC